MDFTADFWTPVKHWAALWISMRHHLPWGVAFLFPCSSQIKPCFVSSHSLRPVVRKTGNLSISSSSSECWKGTRVKVSAVLASVPVQSCYKHLALPFFFFLPFIFLFFPFFPVLFSLSLPRYPLEVLHQMAEKPSLETLVLLPIYCCRQDHWSRIGRETGISPSKPCFSDPATTELQRDAVPSPPRPASTLSNSTEQLGSLKP